MRRLERHEFRAGDRRRGLAHQGPRLVERNRLPNRPHRVTRRQPRLSHQVAEFRQHELRHRQAHGVLRPRQRDDHPLLRQPGARAAEHGGRPDFLEAEHAEQLAEAVQPLLQQAVDCLVGRVARGDPGAAGRDHHLHVRVRQLVADRGAHLVGLVAHDLASGHLVAAGPQQVENRAPAGVGRLGAGVADRQDVAVGHGGRLCLVLQVSHLPIIPHAGPHRRSPRSMAGGRRRGAEGGRRKDRLCLP